MTKQGVHPLNPPASLGKHKVAFVPRLAPYPPPGDAPSRDALVLHKHQWLRLRPLTKSPSCVQEKAKEIQAQLRPARVRPKTNAVVARRMVEHTLGLRSSISKEQRDAERKQLSDARTAKKSTVRWDD
ncbi:hypothetical protein RB195_025330 [Necator americanus]|uniref:Uncharacterized protein n=1 Tax=Necator americanus TaxID=51031 RepID=A0ABR1ERU8_NECAM